MPTSQTSQTFQKCVFTQHDESEPMHSEKLKYLAYAKETCPSTGKEHQQGFAYVKTPMKLTDWKKLFPGTHIESMCGDFKSNTTYCSKEGQLIEHGQPPRQGERTDIQELKVQFDAGKRPLEIADEVDGMFGVVARTHRFAESYFQYKRQKRLADDRTVPEVNIRWGPPGTTGKWFDGCDCDVILFDDVKVNEIPPITQILGLTDRYPIQVPIKNGFITWKPRVIVFTSNFKPKDWWPSIAEPSYLAFKRRITSCQKIVYKKELKLVCPDTNVSVHQLQLGSISALPKDVARLDLQDEQE
jgi:hypothetical protein